MIEVGSRIIFDSVTGEVIVHMGDMYGEISPRKEINSLDYVDFNYGEYPELLTPGYKYHINPVTKLPVQDED